MHGVCPPWLSFILYNPLRKRLTDRRKIMDESGVTAESVVLEVGAGNGFLTETLAARARKVIAVELQDGMVEKLTKRVGRFGDRVDIIRGDIAEAGIGAGVADVSILYYCFHEIRRREDAVANIIRAMKKGGILSLYEPSVEVSPEEMEKTIALFGQSGLALEEMRSRGFTRFARMRKP